METTTIEERIPWKSRIWISLADSSVAMLQTIVGGGALTYYFTRVRGLDPNLAGLVWLLFGIWNAVNDPLFGFISDRTKSKLGRRRPYIRYGAPILTLGFIFLWLDLPASQSVVFTQMLIGLFVYDILYTAIATSIYIMPYEMAVSNKARSSIFIWKIIFMIFPNVLPFVIAAIQPGPGDDPTGYRILLMGMAVVLGLIVFLSTFFYEEKVFTQQEEQFPFLKSLKESFLNFAFVIFLVVSFTVIYIQTSLMQGVAYYFDEIMMTPLPLYLGLAAGIVFGIWFWIRQRDPWGVKTCVRVWLAAFAVGCLIMLLGGKLLIPAVIGFFLIGVGFAGGMYLIPIMNGDVIDYDEQRTGLRREGMYAGINSLVTKPAISLAQAAFLWILQANGYDPLLPKGLQSSQAENGILLAWMLIPAILLTISWLTMRWYPLAGKQWEQIKQRLSVIHEEKERLALKKLHAETAD
jgi:GPH family glycoside/pentoside/hexuronide:cation symporter